MSIFGTTAPKFICNGTTVNLDHFVTTKDEPEYINLMRPSVITHKMNFVQLGYYWHFEGTEYIGKYANASDKFQELISYLYSTVQVYRFRDGLPLQDAYNTPMDFIIYEMTPAYLDGIKRDYDILLIKMRSVQFVDMKKYLQTESGLDILTDPDGKTLMGG